MSATIILLSGQLGAGKTTLVKSALPEFNVTSPTFSITNQYSETIFHIDLYRIQKEYEFENLGLEEILLESKNLVFIEWPCRLPNYILDLIQNPIHIEIDGASHKCKLK